MKRLVLVIFGFICINFNASVFAKGNIFTYENVQKVEINKKYTRIVLTFNFEEYISVADIKGMDNVVGWSKNYWYGRRNPTWDAFIKKYPKLAKIPDVGYFPKGTVSKEKILSLAPDLLIIDSNDAIKYADLIKYLVELNVDIAVIDFYKQDPSVYFNSIELLGKITGNVDRANEINDFYKKRYDYLINKIKKINNKKKVYLEFSSAQGCNTMGTSWGHYMWGGMVEKLNGYNISSHFIKGIEGTLASEQVIKSNPDVIIITGSDFKKSIDSISLGYTVSDNTKTNRGLNCYSNRIGWRNIEAVKNGNVYAIYHDLSRHIYDIAGYEMIAKILYPEEFNEIDPIETLKEYHRKFYPIKFSGIWFSKIEK